jgi:CRP/FNR family cyclic AMP-dependent transcriptional regulator
MKNKSAPMQLSNLFRNTEFFVPFAAGDTIFKEGDPGDMMYVVIDGEVEVVVKGRVVETIGAENFLGEMALIDEQPRSATAIARTDCKLAPINATRFNFLVQQTPHFALHLMRAMADRMRRRSEYIS